jgi:hypothetical protein
LGQIQTYGDSGSGCFDTFNGQRYDVSVFTNSGGDKAFAYASEWESGWCAQVTVTNHTATPTTSWAVRFDVHD